MFSNCAERNPLVRFGNPVHVFNNYYVNTQTFDYSYAIATTQNAGVLVEGNYFENAPRSRTGSRARRLRRRPGPVSSPPMRARPDGR